MKQSTCLAILANLTAQFTANASPIVVSGWLTNVSGNDSPYEYVQLVATRDLDFAATPYTLVWNDVGVAGSTGTASFSDGWAGGSLLSYAFQLAAGTVSRGEVFYVGGSAQLLAGSGSASLASQRWLRTINTFTTDGDTLGTADGTGVFGNGGPNADGIAVFPGLAGTITTTTIPLDSVFFGVSVGTARPASGGFKAAQNDRYISSGVFGDLGNDFLFADLQQGEFQRLAGTYNWVSQQWETPRTGVVIPLNNSSPVSAITSAIVLVPEPCASWILLGGVAGLSMLCRHRKAGKA